MEALVRRMRESRLLISVCLWALWADGSAVALAAQCQPVTAAWERMAVDGLVLVSDTGERVAIDVKVADERDERTAGFQHVCPETIAERPMLFVFQSAQPYRFHMGNVYAPLDIAFIAADGRVVDIQLMQPYVVGSRDRPLYGPPVPVTAALEAREGFFRDHGITPGSWRVILPH